MNKFEKIILKYKLKPIFEGINTSYSMRKKFLFFSFLSAVLMSSVMAQTENTKHLIQFEGKPLFINGINVAWNNFGGDVGNHYKWGTLYNPDWFEKMLSDCEAHGVNCIRLWIHTDGRANPEFNPDGSVKGLDADFYPALDDIFQRAKNHGILIMPCLWSFDMCKDERKNAGMYAGNHADLISDSLKTVSYINNALIPMVKRYDKHCNLFAWEVCNEPEWHMPRKDDPKWKDITEVSVREMQRFTAMIAAAIHKNSSRMVTTGSASLKWNSDVAPAHGNWWSDKALQNAYNDPKAYLDFYQIHYYDWMYAGKYDPFNPEIPYEYWNLDKPCLIGEQPGSLNRDTIYTNDEKAFNAYKNHYAGHMFWSYNGADGVGSFPEFKDACKKMYEAHKDEIFPIIPCKTLSKGNLNFKSEKKKGKIYLSWQAEDASKVAYFDVEKSTDGVNFKWERKLMANEDGDINYFYNDKAEGKVYYRVRLKETGGFEGVSQVYVVE